MAGNAFTQASLRKTEAALKAAELKTAAAASTAEHKGAVVVASEMAARAPVDTGRLQASIRAEGSSAVADTPYALYQEPFAGPAARAAEPNTIAAMIAVFRAALGGR
jgi:hypothetical protein